MSNVTDAIAKIVATGNIAHLWSSGGPTDVVQTDGGPIKTLAGITADAPGAVLAALATASVSQVDVALGTHTFACQAGKGFKPGTLVAAVSGSAVMVGPVVSYSGTTLVMNAIQIIGSGSFAAWNIGLSGPLGPKGDAGTGVTDPGTGTGTGVGATLLTKYDWE